MSGNMMNPESIMDAMGGMEEHWSMFEGAIMQYHGACIVHDWDSAESARATALSHLEIFMDNLGAAHRGIELSNGEAR